MKHFTVPLKLLPPLCSQVSSMLAAGVPQAEILKTACKTAANREMKALLGELEEKVHKGQTLFEAMESMHGLFSKTSLCIWSRQERPVEPWIIFRENVQLL